MEPSLKPVYRNNTKSGASLSNQDQTSNDTSAGHGCHSKKRGLFGASRQSIFQEIEEETNEFETNLARLKEEILDSTGDKLMKKVGSKTKSIKTWTK